MESVARGDPRRLTPPLPSPSALACGASAPGELWTSTGEPDGLTTTALVKYDSLGRELLTIPANLGFALGQFIDGVLHISSGFSTWTVGETGEVTATDAIEFVLPGSSGSVRITSVCHANELRCNRTVLYNGEDVSLPGPGFAFSFASVSSTGRYILDRGRPETRVIDLANPETPMQLAASFEDSLAIGADFLVQADGPDVLITDLVTGTQWTVELPDSVSARFDGGNTLLVVDAE